MKILQVNRKAYRDYEIVDKYDAGIQLFGYEVKAIREGKGSLKGAYIKRSKGSVELIGMDIPKYSKAGEIFDYDSKRTRKLLLNKHEIKDITQRIEAKGYTAIPLKLYLNNNLIKLLIGLGRGKNKQNIKRALINRQEKLEIDRLIKEQNKQNF